MDATQILQQIFSQNGLIATLFSCMLYWVLKTNNDREQRYINTIDNLTTNVSDKINVIEDDITEIKELIK